MCFLFFLCLEMEKSNWKAKYSIKTLRCQSDVPSKSHSKKRDEEKNATWTTLYLRPCKKRRFAARFATLHEKNTFRSFKRPYHTHTAHTIQSLENWLFCPLFKENAACELVESPNTRYRDKSHARSFDWLIDWTQNDAQIRGASIDWLTDCPYNVWRLDWLTDWSNSCRLKSESIWKKNIFSHNVPPLTFMHTNVASLPITVHQGVVFRPGVISTHWASFHRVACSHSHGIQAFAREKEDDLLSMKSVVCVISKIFHA